MTNLYSVVERLEVGDTILWTATAEERDTNFSSVDAITETQNGVEVRVSGPGGGQYTLDFPENKHPNTHWHPPEDSQETHLEAGHQRRRGEVYVGRGPLKMLTIVGRAEDTPESMAYEPLKEALK
ncbi:hypothetical protein [Halorussus caseinilyticus]|uniref:hypothetical protein n=1 Tax=Halorussus caseinilyticus TaxID=3034025 RepID=UPI0023E75F5A|nr:hypothetical protein [Halorussus sp. DT72]